MNSFIGVALVSLLFCIRSENLFGQSQKTTSVVVIELFTSQGCSSCPAADRLLNETIRHDENDQTPVLGLSFHVSYWNYLGWRDPYSSEAFTNRQKKYAEVLNLSNIYTPQMIVNGVLEFVGSDKQALTEAITQSRKEVPLYQIAASVALKNGKAIVHYSLEPEPKDEWMNIALVAPKVQNQVLRGENKGKVLEHDNVVLKLETTRALKTGETVVVVPSDFDTTRGTFIILYVQHRTTLRILSAAKVGINTKGSF